MDMMECKKEVEPATKRPCTSRRGLASRDVNIQNIDYDNMPAADVYQQRFRQASISVKECERLVQKKIKELKKETEMESLREIEEEKKNKSQKKSPETDTDSDDEYMKWIMESPPKAPLSSEVHKLIEDLEKTKAAYTFNNSYLEESDLSVVESESQPTERRTMIVRVMCKDQYHRKELAMDEPFSIVISEVAKKHLVDPSRIRLVYGQDFIEPCDTPASKDLDIANIIEACILDEQDKQSTTQTNNSPNILNIKVQTSNSRVKLNLHINKTDPMLVLMKKFVENISFDLEKLIFRFDGEIVKQNDTATSLGLENGDCIDVSVRI